MKYDDKRTPKAGEIYRHFKGNLYEVLGVAAHTETGEKLVVYRDCTNKERVFARPIDMFMSKVDHIKYPFVRAKYRFELEAQVDEIEYVVEEVVTEEEETEDVTVDAEEAEPEAEEVASDETESAPEETVPSLDPIVEKILDAKEYTEKIENFELLRNRCDESMLATIAMALDIQLEEDSLEGKYAQILKTFRMHEKYETSRLRQ